MVLVAGIAVVAVGIAVVAVGIVKLAVGFVVADNSAQELVVLRIVVVHKLSVVHIVAQELVADTVTHNLVGIVALELVVGIVAQELYVGTVVLELYHDSLSLKLVDRVLVIPKRSFVPNVEFLHVDWWLVFEVYLVVVGVLLK